MRPTTQYPFPQDRVAQNINLDTPNHPIGPTGVGQICEITTQIRGEACTRQHPGEKTGLAQMVVVGAVSVVHVLGGASDELIESLRQVFDDAEFVELGFTVGQFISLGQFVRLPGVPNPDVIPADSI